MKKVFWVIIILVAIILLVVAGIVFGYYLKNQEGSDSGSQSYSSSVNKYVFEEATEEDYLQFENVISQNSLIQDLPDDAIILLSFYSASPEELEKDYLLRKNSVEKGETHDYDMKLIINSKYLTKLNENNFCEIIQIAKNNGDFFSETEMSTTSLLWKYKSVLKYKSCFGM